VNGEAARLEKMIVTLLFLLLSQGILSAQGSLPQPASPQPKGVEVRLQVNPEQATVGDPIRFDFDITVPPGDQVQFPQVSGQLGDFVILESYQGPSVPDPGASSGVSHQAPVSSQPGQALHHRARIIAAVYKTGEYTFPPITWTLTEQSGGKASLSTPTRKVRIQSVLTGKEESLKDLKKQAEIPEPVRWLLWLGIALLLVILGIVSWWLWQRRRRPSMAFPSNPHLDPLQLAESELRDLLARGLLERGLVKQFYVIFSDTLKKMLQAGYGVQTYEKTTAEIISELQMDQQRRVQADEFRRVETLLTACDLVKFARSMPSKADNDTAIKSAFEVLAACRERGATRGSATPAQVAEVR
jgi:hypothetical protein